MKASRLHEVWGSPDNTRLTPKQYSFRLPLHVAAKLAALGEIYPQRPRTQIVADLLTSALDELERSLPEGLGAAIERDFQEMVQEDMGRDEQVYYLGGLRGKFRNLSNERYRELEIEMGGPETVRLFENLLVTKSGIEKGGK